MSSFLSDSRYFLYSLFLLYFYECNISICKNTTFLLYKV
ncbi:Uncharacterised protein [Segatella copri]|nr:Uncharacterised protein [Segatella copri]